MYVYVYTFYGNVHTENIQTLMAKYNRTLYKTEFHVAFRNITYHIPYLLSQYIQDKFRSESANEQMLKTEREI